MSSNKGCLVSKKLKVILISGSISVQILAVLLMLNFLGISEQDDGQQVKVKREVNSEELEEYLEKTVTADIFTQPKQVHISLGNVSSSKVVSWMTRDWTKSLVFYGLHPSDFSQNTEGIQLRFEENEVVRFVHKVTLENLRPGMIYFYYVGSEEGGFSPVFWFKTEQQVNFYPRIAIFGDLGSQNALSLPFLQKEIHNSNLDMVIHAGDFAYDLDDSNGFVGDNFMEQIEPVAAYVPYMVCPGNHEHPDNYKEYRHRFLMPISAENEAKQELQFSFDFGPIHFISLNVEVYYKHGGTLDNIKSMYKWLQHDLEAANRNRQNQPWVIVFGHRPMYCAEGWWDCANNQTLTQFGIPINGEIKYGLESVLNDYKVDVAIWAHKHSFERSWPVFNYTVWNETAEPYVNAKAPIHFTAGSGGSFEGHGYQSKDHPYFLASQHPDFGYINLTVHNSTHLQFDYISAEQNGQIVDSVMIAKSS